MARGCGRAVRSDGGVNPCVRMRDEGTGTSVRQGCVDLINTGLARPVHQHSTARQEQRQLSARQGFLATASALEEMESYSNAAPVPNMREVHAIRACQVYTAVPSCCCSHCMDLVLISAAPLRGRASRWSTRLQPRPCAGGALRAGRKWSSARIMIICAASLGSCWLFRLARDRRKRYALRRGLTKPSQGVRHGVGLPSNKVNKG